MFRDDRQMHRALTVLCERAHLRGYWTAEGPTDAALGALERGELSSGELLILRAAFDLFNGTGGAPLGRLVNVLDGASAEALFGLTLAFCHSDSSKVDAWIARYALS
jgi:hypothetical protein